eukprot:m.164264 g.164264  ORF g.164264 m.164264 type:complete len:303 (-) comp31331_c1_seq1:65-973(-)
MLAKVRGIADKSSNTLAHIHTQNNSRRSCLSMRSIITRAMARGICANTINTAAHVLLLVASCNCGPELATIPTTTSTTPTTCVRSYLDPSEKYDATIVTGTTLCSNNTSSGPATKSARLPANWQKLCVVSRTPIATSDNHVRGFIADQRPVPPHNSVAVCTLSRSPFLGLIDPSISPTSSEWVSSTLYVGDGVSPHRIKQHNPKNVEVNIGCVSPKMYGNLPPTAFPVRLLKYTVPACNTARATSGIHFRSFTSMMLSIGCGWLTVGVVQWSFTYTARVSGSYECSTSTYVIRGIGTSTRGV